MVRVLKPIEVDSIRVSDVKLPIYLDRNRNVFFVRVPGTVDERVSAPAIHELKKKVAEEFPNVIPYAWEPVIVVEVQSEWGEGYGVQKSEGRKGASCAFEFHRVERSPSPAIDDRSKSRKAGFVERDHTIDFEADEPSDHRRKQREKNENLRHHWATSGTVLPYDQATWDGLLALASAVEDARAKLADLVSRKDAAARLRAIAVNSPRLLPAAATRPTRAERRRR